MSGWTGERVERLTKMHADGCSASEIAKALGGVTRNSVIGKIYRLGLARDEAAVHAARAALRPKKTRSPAQMRPRKQEVAPRRPRQNNLAAFNVARRAEAGRPAYDPPPLIFDASQAKPWLERKFGECAYPISGEGADVLSCCQPAQPNGYCKAHAALMFWTPKEDAKRLIRMSRRYA